MSKKPFLATVAACAEFARHNRNYGVNINLNRGGMSNRDQRFIPARTIKAGVALYEVTEFHDNKSLPTVKHEYTEAELDQLLTENSH